jgi:hypothetical protein
MHNLAKKKILLALMFLQYHFFVTHLHLHEA